jgi:D-amino-acid oxidase
VRAEDVFAMINCTGLNVRDLMEGEGREKLRPILGQTLLLRGETKFAGTCVGFPEEWGLLYAIPHPGTGTTILGGSRFDFKIHDWDQNVAGNWNATMTQRMRIWRFANEIAKGDLHWGADGFEVLKFDVNFSAKRQGWTKSKSTGEWDD